MLNLVAQAPVAEATIPRPESEDFEIVLGRRHIASVLFVATVTVVVFSAVAYLAGKSASPRKPTPAPVPVAAVQTPLPEPPPPSVAPSEPMAPSEPPIFSDPAVGAIYLQMGSVDTGVAVILVEGLRKHGFSAFAAPGTSGKVFRVLIGPLPDPQAFTRAKDAVDQIGLATFARKYQQ